MVTAQKKLAVQLLIDHLFFESSVKLADSFVLENRQLLKPTKRYASTYDDRQMRNNANASKKQKRCNATHIPTHGCTTFVFFQPHSDHENLQRSPK